MSVGCFFYDSRWGQSAAEQKHAAARLRPAALDRRTARYGGEGHVAHVRACATRAYIAETMSWEQSYEKLLDDASAVLEPALGLTLESAGTALWKPAHGDTRLDEAIRDLPGCAVAGDDWVVGLVESTPKLVTDYHLLGIGQPFSKYLVMRASTDPRELERISEGLDEIDEGTRQKLYADRKHHKMVTVFLHELAHTLGALHRVEPETIMSPRYDPKARGYDEATLGLLRITLPARFQGTVPLRQIAAYLKGVTFGWVESERAQELERLAPVLASSESQALPSAALPTEPTVRRPVVPVTPLGLDTLGADDRKQYELALASEPGDPRTAWLLAEALFESHPAVMPVQALRCRLAKARKFYPAVVEGHCGRLAALGGQGAASSATEPSGGK